MLAEPVLLAFGIGHEVARRGRWLVATASRIHGAVDPLHGLIDFGYLAFGLLQCRLGLLDLSRVPSPSCREALTPDRLQLVKLGYCSVDKVTEPGDPSLALGLGLAKRVLPYGRMGNCRDVVAEPHRLGASGVLSLVLLYQRPLLIPIPTVQVRMVFLTELVKLWEQPLGQPVRPLQGGLLVQQSARGLAASRVRVSS